MLRLLPLQSGKELPAVKGASVNIGCYQKFHSCAPRELKVFFADVITVFVKPKQEIKDIRRTIGEIKFLQRTLNEILVLEYDNMIARQRDVLVEAGISFVAEKKQIYLPFLGVLFRERWDANRLEEKSFLPATQVIFLKCIYMILKNKTLQQIYLQDVVKELGISAMSVSRALKQLTDANLVSAVKDGVKKIIKIERPCRKLFKKALPYLQSPVKKRVYTDSSQIPGLYLSGESALSMYTMLEHPNFVCYAAFGENNYQDYVLENERGLYKVMLEFWRYDPKLLSEGDTVDILSLYLNFKDSEDERIQMCLEEMMNNFWGKWDV